MKKRYIIMVAIFLSGFLLFSGCGGGGTGGAPGSSESENTGILLKSVSIIAIDEPHGTPDDIDVAIHLCDGGDPEDGLYREDAELTIDASLVNTSFDTFPATVEECKITYLKSEDDPASPIIESWTVYPNCPIVDGQNQCRVQLLDIQRKRDFWDDFISGKFDPRNYPTRYIARYDCKYFNIYRESGHFKVEYEIFLADFDEC